MEEDRPTSDVSFTADELVNNVLEKACDAVASELEEENSPQHHQIRNINWVTSRDFTVEVGEKQLAEYMRTWEVDTGRWLFSLEFIRADEEEHRTLHRYRARWSTPTPRTPIPRATACVDFVVGVSKLEPGTEPVEVSFTVESNRLVHAAGKSRFREKWLEDVVESKMLLRGQWTSHGYI
ncbi:A-kinase anchor protein 14-like [Diretmus argenteus]